MLGPDTRSTETSLNEIIHTLLSKSDVHLAESDMSDLFLIDNGGPAVARRQYAAICLGQNGAKPGR